MRRCGSVRAPTNNLDMKQQRTGFLAFVANQWSLIFAVCVGTGLAHVGTTTMPLQIGALMDATGRSASQAGLFGFCQIAALAFGMIAIAPRLDRVHPAAIAVGSALLAIAANTGLLFADFFPLQLLFGLLTGLAFGFVFAATIAGAARCKQADRLYGIGNGGGLVLIMIVVAGFPILASHFGPRAIFAGIAALSLICSVFFFGLGRGLRSESQGKHSWRAPGVPGLLFSWIALSLGTGAVYSFSERIGRRSHLPAEVIGLVLSTGLLVGFIGTMTAALVAGRLDRPRALVIGIVGTGAACLMLGFSVNLVSFAVGVFSYMLFYMFLYSFLLGTAAQLDDTGRLGALGGGLERLSFSVGVWVGGLLAQYISYSTVGVLGFTGCILGLLFGFPGLFRALSRPEPETQTGRAQIRMVVRSD
jgi:predicted MFS family arabinose efflux permease